ncbi:MAG: hypothetical protein JNK11_12975 [Alphaproteobacteria bacterium]|nr:hypothetical protein [Alphaproteobacteria bacterium]
MPAYARCVAVSVLAAAAWSLAPSGAAAQGQGSSVVIGAFDVEAGGSDPETVAQRLASQPGVDVWGLTRVADAAMAELYAGAAGLAAAPAKYKVALGTSGNLKHAVLFNDQRLALGRRFELLSLLPKACPAHPAPAPLVVELRPRAEGGNADGGRGDGAAFWLIVNRLGDGTAAARACRIKALTDWLRQNTRQAVLVGAFGAEWQIAPDSAAQDPAIDLLLADGMTSWVQPETLVPTHCARPTVADLILTAGRARQWRARSWIAFADEDDYCLRAPERESEHRAVIAQFAMQ